MFSKTLCIALLGFSFVTFCLAHDHSDRASSLSPTELTRYEALLHKPYGENADGVHAMYRDLINIPDSTLRARKADEIKSFARSHKDRRLELNVDFFLTFWNAFYQRQSKDDAHRKLTELVASSTKENTEFLRPRALRALAEFYWKREKNYELAFEQYLLLDKELVSANLTDYPEMARDLMQIGQAYYFFQDYTIAKQYFKRAIALPENTFNTMVINDARNTLGLCYQKENNLDSADYYFNEILKTSFPEALAWKAIATGNLGFSRYLLKQYNKALPLLEVAFNTSVAEHDYGYAGGSAISLADIYRHQGRLEQAGVFIAHAQEYIQKAGQPDKLRRLYPVMSKWYAAAGDMERSKQYVDSAVVTLDR